MTVLGPNDPRAITGKALEDARANTDKWHDILGIKRMTPAQKAKYEKELGEILAFIDGDS